MSLQVQLKSVNSKNFDRVSLEINGERLKTNFKNVRLTDDPDFNALETIKAAINIAYLSGKAKVDCRDAMSMFGLMCSAYDIGRRNVDTLEFEDSFTVER